MKTPDVDRIRSEKKITLKDFLKIYNKDLPEVFPRATAAYLKKFQETYPSLFAKGDEWTLDVHRKKFMDWLPAYRKSLES